MKRNIFLSILFILAVFGLASCETDTIDGDGDVEGFWHLERIEALAADSTGTMSTIENKDLTNELIFWSFQHKLLELSDKNGLHQNILCRFTADNGHLTIGETYFPSYGQDSLVNDVNLLIPYGITKVNQTFTYNVKGGKMTLTGDNVRLHLKRF